MTGILMGCSQVSRFDSGSQPMAEVAEVVCPPQDEAQGGNQSETEPGMDSRLSLTRMSTPAEWLT